MPKARAATKSRKTKETKVVGPPRSIESILEELKQKKESPELTMGWKQYAPFRPEKPRKKRFLNTASIWVFAKKMIAKEMRAAKGIKPKVDPQRAAMERFAAEWDRKKEEEKVRQQKLEEERKRRQRKEEMLEAMLGESLEVFAEENQRLKAERQEQKAVTNLFRQALDAVGEVRELTRSDGGWKVQMEPWEAKRTRRLSGEFDSSPVIYEVKLDKDFYITSCSSSGEPFAAKRILAQLNNELDRKVRKPLELKMEEAETVGSPRPIRDVERQLLEQEREQEREVARLCEQAFEDFGRLMKITKTEDGWKARVELWEEMGMRQKAGKQPILFDLKLDNELKVVSYQGI